MNGFLKKIVVSILIGEARLVLWRYKPKIVAITGSVGKTSTKDAIYTVLSKEVHARKSEKSFNSEIGVPLTILGCANAWTSPLGWIHNIIAGLSLILLKQSYPTWLVLEVGADRPGDIRNIARWLSPDIVVITSIPSIPVHVEFFSSPDELAKEKRQLVVHIKSGGTLFINGDDERTVAIRDEFRGIATSFGFNKNCDFHASHDEFAFDGKQIVGIQFRVNHGGSSVPVTAAGALGKVQVYSALAALAVAESLGFDLVSSALKLRDHVPPPGRMRIIRGKNDSIIIDDTYNSSPVAVFAALDALINIPSAKKRIAVLGDMLELGKYSTEAHKGVGVRVRECVDSLITVGFRAKAIAQAARGEGLSEKKIREYDQGQSEQAGMDMIGDLGPGTIVLVKGSQSMRMERTVKALMAEPERAKELLVRQESEWMNR